MLSVSMPKARTASVLVETATKCFARSASPARCRNQLRAADADIDDIGNRLAAAAQPVAVAHAFDEAVDAIQNGMNVRADVLSIYLQGLPARRAQGGMQHRPVFGEVDLFATEHGRAPGFHTAFAGQLKQQLERSIVDTVF